jgi:hypothetical protein
VSQALQIVGALLILAAFALAQFGKLTLHCYQYLLLNLVGSAVLAWLAWEGQQWGFLLLEGVWTLITLWSLIQRLVAHRQGRGTPSL